MFQAKLMGDFGGFEGLVAETVHLDREMALTIIVEDNDNLAVLWSLSQLLVIETGFQRHLDAIINLVHARSLRLNQKIMRQCPLPIRSRIKIRENIILSVKPQSNPRYIFFSHLSNHADILYNIN